MKVDKLLTNAQPSDWFESITSECRGYPLHMFTQLDKSSVVVDAGCNVGGFFNAFKDRFDDWTCIDASSYNIEQFKSNNPKFSGVLLHKALSDESKNTVKLMKYTDQNLNDTPSGNFGIVNYVSSVNNHGWKDNVYEEVETLSIEDLLILKDGKIDLLKVDIEGLEHAFLHNKSLDSIDCIVMELHNFLGDKQKELCDWIGRTHTEIFSVGDGIGSHFLKAWRHK